jgi:uncharacterized protein
MAATGPRDGSWDWPLPATPYRPGQTARPGSDGLLSRLAQTAPNPTRPEDWRSNTAYRAGWRLFAHGYGWEAHEVWEPVWMHCRPNSAERHLMQGLIQLANARLKLAMGRASAARRLVVLAQGLLGEGARGTAAPLMGVDTGALHITVTALGASGIHSDAQFDTILCTIMHDLVVT